MYFTFDVPFVLSCLSTLPALPAGAGPDPIPKPGGKERSNSRPFARLPNANRPSGLAV